MDLVMIERVYIGSVGVEDWLRWEAAPPRRTVAVRFVSPRRTLFTMMGLKILEPLAVIWLKLFLALKLVLCGFGRGRDICYGLDFESTWIKFSTPSSHKRCYIYGRHEILEGFVLCIK